MREVSVPLRGEVISNTYNGIPHIPCGYVSVPLRGEVISNYDDDGNVVRELVSVPLRGEVISNDQEGI